MPTEPIDTVQGPLYSKGVAIVNDYQFRSGVCVLPLAEDPPTSQGELASYSPVVILRLHAPYRIRRVNYAMEKENNPPVIPSPEDAGAFKFVGGNLQIVPALNTTLNNFDWAVSSEYFFVEDCVSRPQDGFVLGSPPWTWSMTRENQNQYPPPLPGTVSGIVGAIGQAGYDARIGYTMGNSIESALTSSAQGSTVAVPWGYNQASYFPGTLVNAEILNGGPANPV